jgi:GntR family transcriptional repressor for pyruvate dehydrogenase complex
VRFLRRKKQNPVVNPLAKSFLMPLARSTLTAGICRKLLSHLMRGEWEEGERIPPERELCQQLGVGRVSLREALKALEVMGMIETRLGDGTFVCRRSEFLSRPLLWAITGSNLTDARELVEARRSIEVELTGFAAERATSEELKELESHLLQMKAALNNAGAFQKADIEFHLALGRAAHNQILQNALQLIRNLMRQWIGTTLALNGVAAEALRQHRKIFLAVSRRDSSNAQAAMRHHLDAMARHLSRAHSGAATPKPSRRASR